MCELDAILDELRGGSSLTCDGVLTTIVHVEGSAYRRPGARMLILADGRRIGTVSGGCLESDVSRKAWWFTQGGSPAVRSYDTSSDDDASWEFGLGCNGVVHVLFERIDSAATRELIAFLRANRKTRPGVVVATVVSCCLGAQAAVGQRLLIGSNGALQGELLGHPLQASILEHAQGCFLRQKSCLVHMNDLDVFVEWVGARVPLVVFGAGHDAMPLVRFASELGWNITLADGRPNYATSGRFPGADRIVIFDPEADISGIDISRDSIVVLMTHNYPLDVQLLRQILPAKPRYLGLLGPKSRSEKLLEAVGLSSRGIDVHAPVGLDLGSDAPEAIALSIVAEIQASLSGRDGTMLKLRDGSIHLQAEEYGSPSRSLGTTSENIVCELI